MRLIRRLARTLLLYTIFATITIYTLLTLRSQTSHHAPTLALNTCRGSGAHDRICRLQNFCFHFDTSKFIHIAPEFILKNIHNSTDRRFADMSSVDDHNTYYWHWETEPVLPMKHHIVDKFVKHDMHYQVLWVSEPVHLVKRFFPVNLMHMFHDDLLSWQDVHRHINPDIKELWFIDDYGRQTANHEILSWTIKPGVKVEHLLEYKGPKRMVCFSDATVGTSKRLVWYQYGYRDKEGPVENSMTRGDLSDAFDWFRQRANSSISSQYYKQRDHIFKQIKNGKPITNPHQLQITVFTRAKTRLLLNTAELVADLEKAFGLPVKQVGLEFMTVEQVIAEMSKTVVAVGMHGALLITTGFMPPGSVLIEAYPYAVPPSQYTPYRTLCTLLHHRYRYWSSPHAEPPWTVGHPERGKFEGGLQHLSEEERQRVMALRWVPEHKCCYDAAWMYRVLQDTMVDTDDIVRLIREAVSDDDGE